MNPTVPFGELYDQLQAIANALEDPILVIDYDGRYVAVLGGHERSSHDWAKALIGQSMQDIMPKEAWRPFLEVVRKAVDTGTLQVYDYQLPFVKSDGRKNAQWFQGRVYPVARQPGRPPTAIWLAINISEHKQLEEKLKNLAEMDDLTGTHNRRYFLRRLESEFEIAQRRSLPLSLIILDADHFKLINDRYGHPQGDLVLQFLTRAVAGQLRETDILARIGGEEFAILSPATDKHQSSVLAERIRRLIAAAPVHMATGSMGVTLSCGVTAKKDSDTSFKQLMRRADEALYQAKREGRNRVCCS